MVLAPGFLGQLVCVHAELERIGLQRAFRVCMRECVRAVSNPGPLHLLRELLLERNLDLPLPAHQRDTQRSVCQLHRRHFLRPAARVLPKNHSVRLLRELCRPRYRQLLHS